MKKIIHFFNTREIIDEPPPAQWLFSNRASSILWLVVRLYIGIQWIQAGVQKLWGSENPGFWHNGGAAVKGFALGGIAQSHSVAGAPATVYYNWWVDILRSFVIPNASWIAKCDALGEFVVGCALCLGLFTGLTAFAGVIFNFSYVFTGAVASNPVLIIGGILLIMGWRVDGLIGFDGILLPALGTPWKPGTLYQPSKKRRAQLAAMRGEHDQNDTSTQGPQHAPA